MELLQHQLDRHRDKSITIVGDLNAKNSLWGNPLHKSEDKGDLILDFCAQNELEVWNDPTSEATFSGSQGGSWIDLALGRLRRPIHLVRWELESRETLTVHRPIVSVISSEILTPLFKYWVRISDLNLLKLRVALSERIGRIDPAWVEGNSVDESVEQIREILKNICAVVKRNRRPRVRIVP